MNRYRMDRRKAEWLRTHLPHSRRRLSNQCTELLRDAKVVEIQRVRHRNYQMIIDDGCYFARRDDWRVLERT